MHFRFINCQLQILKQIYRIFFSYVPKWFIIVNYFLFKSPHLIFVLYMFFIIIYNTHKEERTGYSKSYVNRYVTKMILLSVWTSLSGQTTSNVRYIFSRYTISTHIRWTLNKTKLIHIFVRHSLSAPPPNLAKPFARGSGVKCSSRW